MSFLQCTSGALAYTAAPQLSAAGVIHGFSTRLGGVSGGIFSSLNLAPGRGDDPGRVEENFRRFCAAVGADFSSMVFSRQVHGDGVRVCTAADRGKGLFRPVDYEADALLTDVPGLPLVVFTADCTPILLYDPVRHAAAAIHAGWRGTAAGIAARAAERMAAVYGSDPADLLAAIGPCIGPCCFETRSDVPQAMTAALGSGAGACITDHGDGRFHVDLPGLNALWLTRAGLSPRHIDRSGECTMCLPQRYWSHRYTQGRRGSQAALIQLSSDPPQQKG